MKFTTTLISAIFVAGMALGHAAHAQSDQEIAALEAFLTAETVDANAFAQSFLNSVPAEQLGPVREQVTAGLGELQEIRADGDRYLAVYENGNLPALIQLNDDGKIAGLRLLPPEMGPAEDKKSPAEAQSPGSGDSAKMAALEKFLTADSIDTAWFAQSFLNQVPVAQLDTIRQQISNGLGAFVGIERNPEGNGYHSVYAEGYIPTTISLDGEGKINGLFFKPPVPSVSSSEEAVGALKDQDGSVAVLVQKNGEPLHAHNADQPLAIGSAFKLSILAALLDEIESGDRSWSDVYTLTEADKSLPSGNLRQWPAGAQLTLYSLAARMISESDNTATDALLHALGRDAVENHAPERNRPFLTTREAFILKNPDNAETADAFLAGNEMSRRQLLSDSVELPTASVAVFESGNTVRPEIEWFYTAEELCAVMQQVAASDVTQINDGGLASAGQWQSVSFKGGSEPGVFNLTYWVSDDQGDEYCVAVTRNHDESFDYAPIVGQANALIGTLTN